MIEYIVKFNEPTRPDDAIADDARYVYFREGETWRRAPDIPSLYRAEHRATRYATPEAAFAAALPYLGMGGGYVVLPVGLPDPLPEPIETNNALLTRWGQVYVNLNRRDVDDIRYRVRIEFLERLS